MTTNLKPKSLSTILFIFFVCVVAQASSTMRKDDKNRGGDVNPPTIGTRSMMFQMMYSQDTIQPYISESIEIATSESEDSEKVKSED